MRGRKQKDAVAPKGFDIILADAISKLELSDDEIQHLGQLTATRRSGLAHATIGHQVWYREQQLRTLFNRGIVVGMDLRDPTTYTGRIGGKTLNTAYVDEATEMTEAQAEAVLNRGEQA